MEEVLERLLGSFAIPAKLCLDWKPLSSTAEVAACRLSLFLYGNRWLSAHTPIALRHTYAVR